MHRLNRPHALICLRHYEHGRDNWSAVSNIHKIEIWAGLNSMQQYRCAYCECDLRTSDGNISGHIEHFRQRGRYPQGTFDWSNLFGSCNRPDSCGKHKDKQHYPHQQLIKMDVEEPDDFLRFLPDGQVVPADNLTAAQQQRAAETIRVFNLDGSLRQIRQTHVMGYLQTAEEIAQLATEFDEDEWRPLLDQELRDIAGQPFETAIRHVLQFA